MPKSTPNALYVSTMKPYTPKSVSAYTINMVNQNNKFALPKAASSVLNEVISTEITYINNLNLVGPKETLAILDAYDQAKDPKGKEGFLKVHKLLT